MINKILSTNELKIYKDLIESAKIDSKKILSESRQKLNEDMQVTPNNDYYQKVK